MLKKLSHYYVQLLIYGCEHFLWSELEHNISNGQVKVAAKNINAKLFACELWVKRVGIFGVVLYRNQ